MKKIAIALSILIVVLLLVGCGIPQDVQDELHQLRSDVDRLGNEKENCDGEREQLNETVKSLEAELAESKEALRNPTYDELMNFLKEDRTEAIRPPTGGHLDMAHTFLRSASVKGIIGFLVMILIQSDEVWYFTGFETSDRGTVYILPAMDQEVKLVEGQDYAKANKFNITRVDTTIVKIWEFNFKKP